MKILQNNPYRLLGVYANSPTKERVANHNRMKAFLKVGKPVSFPLDLPQYLADINRTDAMVADADARLTLPKDQMLYAQFWFIKLTPLDEIAFNHLFANEIGKAEDIWLKKETVSALQNRIVCALMRNDYACAMSCAEILYSKTQYINQFVDAILGTGGQYDAVNMALVFLDMLCEEVDPNQLLPHITNDTWNRHIGERATKPLIEKIQSAISVAKKSKGNSALVRLQAGEALQKSTREALLKLEGFLSKTDLQYQMIADKLGLEILQCSIDYFNNSEDANAAYKAMELQKYAKSIVVGQMAKDRCKENVDILQKIIDNLPPSEVFVEDKAIHDELQKFCLLPDNISNATALLNNTKSYLQTIKSKLGESNAYYLRISTTVVGVALNNVIAEVNGVLTSSPNIGLLKPVLKEACKSIYVMDTFDMDSTFKTENYSKNKIELLLLMTRLGIALPASTSKPVQTIPKKTPLTTYTTGTSSTTKSTNDTQSSGSDSNGCIFPILNFIMIVTIFVAFCTDILSVGAAIVICVICILIIFAIRK